MRESERQVNTFFFLKSRLKGMHSMNPWKSTAVQLSGVGGLVGGDPGGAVRVGVQASARAA